MGYPPQDHWLPPRTATRFVAASTASDRSRAQADLICDGVDDQVEILAMLAELPFGGKLFLSEGVFNITDPIVVPANYITIEAQGNATMISGAGLADGEHCIEIRSRTGVAIRRMTLMTLAGGGNNCHCIFIDDDSSLFDIENVTIGQSDADGIHIEGIGLAFGRIDSCLIMQSDGSGIYFGPDALGTVVNVKITNNLVQGCDGNMIYFAACTGYSDCEITNNIVDTGALAGIYVEEFYDGEISGNYITATDDGIVVTTNSIRNRISNNELTSLVGQGIVVDAAFNSVIGNNVNYTDEHGIVITGEDCLVADNIVLYQGTATPGTYHGIFIQADRALILDNYISGQGVDTEDGIRIDDGFGDCKIDGNRVYDVMGSGIALVANNLECVITNNSIYFCDDYGIELTDVSCDSNIVLNNHFSGNVTGQFLDNGMDTRVHEVFVPVPNPSTNIGTHPAEQLTDGLDVVSRFNLKIPDSYQELVTCHAIVVPGGTGNMRRSVAADWGKVGSDVYNMDSGAIAAGQVAVTTDVLETIDISAALVGSVSGVPVTCKQIVGVEFTREASNVNDTVDADCYLLGLTLRYV